MCVRVCACVRVCVYVCVCVCVCYLARPRVRVDARADKRDHIGHVLAEAGEDEEGHRVVVLLLAAEADGEVDDGGVDEAVEDGKDDRGLQNALCGKRKGVGGF